MQNLLARKKFYEPKIKNLKKYDKFNKKQKSHICCKNLIFICSTFFSTIFLLQNIIGTYGENKSNS